MKCAACAEPLELSWKAAIAENFCPFCGEHLLNREQSHLKTTLEKSLASLAATEDLSSSESIARIASQLVAAVSFPPVPPGLDEDLSDKRERAPIKSDGERRKPRPIRRGGQELGGSPAQGDLYAGMTMSELENLGWEAKADPEVTEDSEGEDYSDWFPESDGDSELRERAAALVKKAPKSQK